MRVVNDLNMGSNNYYSQNSPSFGAVYTKSSVKLLKSFIPVKEQSIQDYLTNSSGILRQINVKT